MAETLEASTATGKDPRNLWLAVRTRQRRKATSVKSERDSLMSPKDLSDYLNAPLSTIYGWRYRGGGPVAIKIGRHLRFRPQDVEDWLTKHTAR
jgi:excisionase family DNA binding protein